MKETSRTKNTARNIIWGLLLKITAVFLPFINRTVIIRTLGIEYAGVANLFASILSVLSLAELGINSAILFSMYKTIAENNISKTNALLNYYKKAYNVIGVIILVVGICICFKLDIFIAGDYPSDLNIYIVFLLYLLNSVSSYYFNAYSALVLTANQREDINFKINIIVNLSREFIQFLVLVLFKNYYLFTGVLIVSTIVHNIIAFSQSKKKYPNLVAEGLLNNDEKRILRKQISGLVIGKLSVVSRNSFDSIVISSFLGLIPTAIYGNYYYIMNALFGLIYYFCSGMRASIGNKIATASVDENYKDMLSFSYGFYVIYGSCTVCLYCLYQPFMELWVGSKYLSSSILPLLMSLYFFLFCGVGIISQYWEAAGLFWENRIRFIAEAIVNLVCNIIFVQLWGINGIISATIVSMFFATNILGPYISFKYYFKNCDIKKYFLKQLMYLIVTLVVALLCYWACKRIIIGGVIGILIKGILCFLFSFSINILVFINTNELSSMISLFNRLVSGKIVIYKKKLVIIMSFTIVFAILLFAILSIYN